MPDSIYPPLQEAIAAGLFHPGCTHTLGAYIPGLTEPFESTENPEGYEQRQTQRGMERKLRAWKRKAVIAEAAGDTRTAQFARQKARQTADALQTFIAETGRMRSPQREALLRGKPYATPPQEEPYKRRKTLDAAQNWADEHGAYRVTGDMKQASRDVAGLLYAELPPEEQERKAKRINREIGDYGTDDPDELRTAQNVVNSLAANPLWRKIEEAHGVTHIIPQSFTGDDSDRVLTYEGNGMRAPMAFALNVRDTSDMEPTPDPDYTTLEESGGAAALVRRAYGMALLGRNSFSPEFLNRYLDTLPDAAQVQRELLSSAKDDPMQTFADLFSIVTHPRYDASRFPKWVDSMRDMIIEELGV